jgi:7-cyano-7-deazaguanine synthase
VAPLEILDLPIADLYGEHWSVTGVNPPDDRSPDEATYLPGRNILLLAKAGVFAAANGCRAIVLGALAANPFPDATPTFFEAMATALGHGMGLDDRLSIETPLVGRAPRICLPARPHLFLSGSETRAPTLRRV